MLARSFASATLAADIRSVPGNFNLPREQPFSLVTFPTEATRAEIMVVVNHSSVDRIGRPPDRREDACKPVAGLDSLALAC